jgi:hypothetical protein
MLPWSLVRNALEQAFGLGLIERTLNSGAWPCDLGGAGVVKIRTRKVGAKEQPKEGYGAVIAKSDLETHELQELADQLAALREATAGHALRLSVVIEIGEAGKVPSTVVQNVNGILGKVKKGWMAGT